MEKKTNASNASNAEVFAKAETQTSERNGIISRMLSKSKERKKTKTKSSGLKKKVGAVALAGALALGTAGLAGCNNIFNPSNPNPSIDPDPINPEPDSTYSELLTAVNESSYYNDIINRFIYAPAEEKPSDVEYSSLPLDNIQNNYGLDISDLDSMSYTSRVYIKKSVPNILYSTSRIIVNDARDPYYIFITLGYPITQKESKEIDMLNRNQNIRAGFVIQELSKQRDPIEENSIKLTQRAYNGNLETFKNSDAYTKVLENNDFEIVWLGADVDAQTAKIAVYVYNSKENGFVSSGEIRYMTAIPAIIDEVSTVSYDSTIFDGPIYFNVEDINGYYNGVGEGLFYIQSISYYDYRADKLEEIIPLENLKI